MMELESHRLEDNTVKIGLGKSHPQMLKLVGKGLMRNRTCI